MNKQYKSGQFITNWSGTTYNNQRSMGNVAGSNTINGHDIRKTIIGPSRKPDGVINDHRLLDIVGIYAV